MDIVTICLMVVYWIGFMVCCLGELVVLLSEFMKSLLREEDVFVYALVICYGWIDGRLVFMDNEFGIICRGCSGTLIMGFGFLDLWFFNCRGGGIFGYGFF